MYTPDEILALGTAAAGAIGAALFAFAKVAVPLGLLGGAIELAGKRFGWPRVEAAGDKIEKFFTDFGGLLGKGSDK